MLRIFGGFFLIFLIAAGALGIWGWNDYQSFLETKRNIPPTAQSFTVESGWSAKRVANEFTKVGVIDKPHWFELYARHSELAPSIKSGEFELPASATVPELLDILVAGKTVQYSQAIIEGHNWRQVRAQLAESKDLVQTLGDISDAELMTKLGLEQQHPEGIFFADTYGFPRDTTDLEYLERANKQLQSVLQEEWEQRDDGLPFESAYEALILASIVEKETAVPAERPLIAGVFVSRLRKRMRLQTDPTVIYGMGEAYDGNIRRKDLTTDTPYNTYTRGGLPPTPISMVGREAINAVMHPENTTSLYFVARGDGTHQFSDTLDQHNAAVQKYQLKR